ncbi:hypothetical protein BN1047_01117 [Mycolicibacterium neoaurum]|uniref:Uncharacterized protein n=1 Tax=Mycolicibacterium neoaurum TaxID=1795 RepID=A0AAV2WGA7_MYCNE|nr:hypothetical protein BN1047_01117 [Mycolicibacterium neoaurum]
MMIGSQCMPTGFEFPEHDLPGGRIHRQHMRGQHQDLGTAVVVQPDRVEQHAAFWIEPLNRRVGMRGNGGNQFTARPRLGEQLPLARLFDQAHRRPVEPAPEHLVTVDHIAQQCLQTLPGDIGGQPDRLGLRQSTRIPMRQQPVPRGQQRDRSGAVGVDGIDDDIVVDRARQLPHGRAFQHQPGAQRNSAPAHRLHHRQRHDAVQSEVQEIGVDVHDPGVEQIPEHLGDRDLGLGARRGELRSHPDTPIGIECGQCPVVDLPVGRQRDLIDIDDVMWDKVLGQRRGEHPAQVRGGHLGHHIRRQPRTAAVPAHRDMGVPHLGVPVERGHHLTGLHPETPNLDLVIAASEVLQRTRPR